MSPVLHGDGVELPGLCAYSHCANLWSERRGNEFFLRPAEATHSQWGNLSQLVGAVCLSLQGTSQEASKLRQLNLRLQKKLQIYVWKTRKIAAQLGKTGHMVPHGSPKQQVLNTSEECIKLYIPTVVMFTCYYKGGNSFLTKDDGTWCFEKSEWKWLDNFYALPCNHK